MADPLSITAGVIAVTTLAYNSAKTLYDLINGMHEAPKTIRDLNKDLGEVQSILTSFKEELAQQGNNGQSVSQEVGKCLEEVKPSMAACADTCDEFKTKLARITSHSTADRTSLRDRFRLQLQDKEINAFKYRLSSYKTTVNVALSFASMKSTAKTVDAIRRLETDIESSMNTIVGQIEGIEIGMAAVTNFGAEKEELVQAMNSQIVAFNKCIQVCLAALAGTSKATGDDVRYARSVGRARQLVGTIGRVEPGVASTTVGVMIAGDDSRQMGGRIAGDVALEFMK